MAEPSPFLYFELRPPAPLQDHVQTYWGFEVRGAGADPVHTVWPDGCLSLFVRLRPGEGAQAGFSGPRLEPLAVPVVVGESYRGVRLWPWAIRPLLGLDPTSLRERGGPLVALAPVLAAGLTRIDTAAEALPALEQLLLARAAAAAPADPAVRGAVQRITEAEGGGSIASVARAVGLSERQLRRRFRVETGLSPKEYARVRRLRTAADARLREGAAWSSVAARFGFADQAHLVREVSALTGFTPTGLESRLQRIEHRDVRP